MTAETSGLRCKPDGYRPSSGESGENRDYSSNPYISEFISYFHFYEDLPSASIIIYPYSELSAENIQGCSSMANSGTRQGP